jgi:exopolyphosphatase/guanosine-5'-triphosphate,3'-diphosphate pyrophosphatase
MAEKFPPGARMEITDGGDAGREEQRSPASCAAFPAPASGAPGEQFENPFAQPCAIPGERGEASPGEGQAQTSFDTPFGSGGAVPPLRQASGQRPGYRQSYAAIDLGTNNCRLLIARPSGENFIVVDAFSRVVRLGEGLAQTGRLSQAAMDRALAALHVCADKLRRREVHLARSVATEACRRAENGAEFIERVRCETGIALDIISAREEARLAVLGCHILLESGNGPAMIFDIGGGSTELVLIDSTAPVPHILDWQSVPWGVVSLTETCGPEGADRAARHARYVRMRELVSDSFAPFAERASRSRVGAGALAPLRLLGTSGTVTTLASLHLDLPQYDRSAVDGLVVPADSMRAISTRLSSLSIEERRELPCIGRERADLVVAGCAILEAILDLWPADRLGVADRGIREGILRSLISANGQGERLRAEIRRMRHQS